MYAYPAIDIPTAYIHPTGSLQIWGTDTPPSGWLLCYGQAVSRTTYAYLFAIIGTTFGVGNGSTTFNLPDLRGRTPLGKDNMGGVSANRVTHANADSIGGAEGAESHALSIAELASHKHALRGTSSLGDSREINGLVLSKTQDGYEIYRATPPNQTARVESIDNTGSGNAHTNMSPYITTNYIIKE